MISKENKHLPVYITNSIYNTNPNFDAGLFENMQTRVLNANMDIKDFYFSFSEEATYTFADYSDQNNLLIFIKVSSTCPAKYSISPLNLINLEKYNIVP